MAPAPTAQYNFTDPDSRIMPSSDGFVQAYNGQVAVDSARQIIVACDVTNDCTDARWLPPLLDHVRRNTGGLPDTYSADSGYWSEADVAALEQRGIGAYIPPPPTAPPQGRHDRGHPAHPHQSAHAGHADHAPGQADLQSPQGSRRNRSSGR